jgi:exosortase B
VCLGFLLLALPMFWDWSSGRIRDGMQGHESALFAVSIYLLYRRRATFQSSSGAAPIAGRLIIAGALALYVFGRAFDLRLALVSIVITLAGVLVHRGGFALLRTHWFAVVFPLFALPLPVEFVLEVTGPLKIAVSSAAAGLLSAFGLPIGRSGVVITIGQYQLLVTEACAGLQTMFTLEAMGLLYAALRDHDSALRNTLLAVLVVPIAFAANVIRVIVLCLVTYVWGDAAGQGFLHGFSGLVLFLAALVLVALTDGVLGRLLPKARR